MSKWSGFSLTPHLRIDEGFGREDQANGFSVMPLCSDGSLCVVDPFRRPYWRSENTMDGGRTSEDDPKLENFLGCYSNSPSNETKVYCQQEDHRCHQNHADRINDNLAPSFNTNGDVKNGENSLTNLSSLIQSYHFNDNPHTLIPNHCLQHYNLNPSHSHNHESGMNQVPFESASSVSGFKSWLRQTAPFSSSGKSPNEANNSNFQSLLLTMSPRSQNGLAVISPLQVVEPVVKPLAKEPVSHKSIDTFGQRTSQYKGVTRHRWTGRYEAHLWDNSCRKEGQTRKGRQGGYDKEEKAARAYDLAALKYWGPSAHINFPLNTYEKELEEMRQMTRQEFVANLRRKSSGFSRGASVYRGVTRHQQHGRWQARIGRVAGNKDLYLGTFTLMVLSPLSSWRLNVNLERFDSDRLIARYDIGTQEEAAEAYDIAAIKFRGTSAVTNFGTRRYDVKRICSSSTLIASDLAKRSSKDWAPVALEDYNSCASSTSCQPLLGSSSSEASDELTGMMWSDQNTGEHQQQRSANNDVTLVASSSRNSSNAASPKRSAGLFSDFVVLGNQSYCQGYFPLQGGNARTIPLHGA
ncbi:hypothetical protein SADUNF_Sadunf03G0039700 [Salix dunnii]|uniref:AP2/ERF domain-containing protein n=1 Tax=Salix dunnii TaxID=1413687 RepID=A0A835N1P2_9ROSI|nr:hypothetical protein SADUNF_Sadunf03G0039700 [Salix dunnii]